MIIIIVFIIWHGSKSKKIERFTMPDYNKRIANWIYYNGSAIADQAKIYHNTVLL